MLIRMHAGVDPLFTPTGFETYVDDLLRRVGNPWIPDTCARIGRDPRRKLGWDDRLVGVVRRAIGFGIEPWRNGYATLAALTVWAGAPDATGRLRDLWLAGGAPGAEAESVAAFLDGIRPQYVRWLAKADAIQ